MGSKFIFKCTELRRIASLGTQQYLIALSFTFHVKFSAAEICIAQPFPPYKCNRGLKFDAILN
jgi:hypothetical protein